jgi:hypothetical protein
VSTWDNASLLQYANDLTGRTGTDSITDVTKYRWLSIAQNQVIADMAAIVPHVLYPTVATGSLPTLTVDASGTIATFGTDPNGYAKFPMGHGNIFQSLDDIPTNPFVNYMVYGTGIRSLNNDQLPSTLYWYGISQPADIDASTQPSIFPEAARELIGQRYAYNFGLQGNRNAALSASMAELYGYPLHASKPGRFAFWCLTWKTQFDNGGALPLTGLQLAIAGGQYGVQAWAT